MVYVFRRIKDRIDTIPKVRVRIMPLGDEKAIAEGIVELLDEGYS